MARINSLYAAVAFQGRLRLMASNQRVRNLSSGKITRRQADSHRASIRVGELIARMQRFAMAETDDGETFFITRPDGERIEVSRMTREQLNASNTLLGKVLPDLKSVEYKSEAEQPTHGEILQRMSAMLEANPALLERLVERHPQLLAAIPGRLIEGETNAEKETRGDDD